MNVRLAQDRPRQLGPCRVRQEAAGTVVQRLDESAEAILNPTAFALWELCDGTTSVAEMVEAVCQLFDINPGKAATDVADGLRQLRHAGLVS